MVRGPRPGARAISGATSGLNIQGSMTNAMLPSSVGWSFDFEPSIGILAGRVGKLGLDIRSFREPLTRAIREVMVPSIRKNFDEGGRPPWEPLSEMTFIIRQKMGISGRETPLVVSGRLRRVASQINVWTVTDKSATVRGLPVPYAGIHQAGYGTGSMKAAIAAAGGDSAAALQKILDQQRAALESGGTLGGRGKPSPIPQRQFLMFQPQDEEDIHDVFAEWLEERIDRVWSRGV